MAELGKMDRIAIARDQQLRVGEAPRADILRCDEVVDPRQTLGIEAAAFRIRQFHCALSPCGLDWVGRLRDPGNRPLALTPRPKPLLSQNCGGWGADEDI